MTAAYQFTAAERPLVPGSPFNPEQPPARRIAYAAMGSLVALTAGLGVALVNTNLLYFQGTLGLTARETAWIPAAYAAPYICANLILVKFRQQFGFTLFTHIMLIVYVAAVAMHLSVHSFWSALFVRGASGFAAAGLTTLGTLCWFQALPAKTRILGLFMGVGLPQIATPLARVIAPALLDWGDWRMSYVFELGLAMLALAAVLALPLPPSERMKAFEKTDLATISLLFPAVTLLCSVLALGRVDWWFSTPWLGWASIAAILLFTAAGAIEHRRSNPLLMIDFLADKAIVKLVAAAFFIRVITSEQTFGSVGLFSTLGMGIDQLKPLFVVVTLASLAGLVAAIVTFKPEAPTRVLPIACLLIAVAAFMDSSADNLTRPMNVCLSQAIVGFATLLFISPTMVTGLGKALVGGFRNFISWLVVFIASQQLGGLVGIALFGTIETVREKFHSAILVQQAVPDNPAVAARFAETGQQLGAYIADPVLRNAESAALLSREIAREANVLAFNDVFLIVGLVSALAFLWAASVQMKIRRSGDVGPVVQYIQYAKAALATLQKKGAAS
jgi:MFS family permease